MADFTVRIVLHGPQADYKALHDAMRDAGFRTFVRSMQSGKRFKLPAGVYRYWDQTASALDVCELATRIAKKAETKTADAPSVYVTKGTSNAFSGLEETTEAEMQTLALRALKRLRQLE